MSKEKSHIVVRLLKILGWILLGILILGGGLRLALKTDWATNLAREKAISAANNNLNGTLSIDRMDGDLWKELTITGINLTKEDTLLHVDSLYVNYEILSLLGGNFHINELNITGLNSTVRETSGEEFNVQQVVKTDTASSEEGGGFGFRVDKLSLKKGNVSVYSPSYLPDSTLKVQRISLDAALGIEEEITASLNELSFDLKEGRLPDPVKIKASASYDNRRITLQEMAIETSRSLLSAKGTTDLADTTVDATAQTKPLALADINPYLDRELPDEKFNISVSAAGSADSMHVSLNANGTGFDSLMVITDLSFRDRLTIHKAGINGKNIDVTYFTNDSVDAFIGELRASAEGSISPDSIEQADVTWGFSLYNLRYQDYSFKELFGSGTLIDQNVLANLQLSDGQDKIITNNEIYQVFSESPEWKSMIMVDNIDAGWWMRDPSFQSDISFRGNISGKGFQLSDNPWTYEFTGARKNLPVKKGVPVRKDTITVNGRKQVVEFPVIQSVEDTVYIAGQKFSDFELKGQVTRDSLSAEGFIKLLKKSSVQFEAALADFTTDQPSYSFQVSTSEFDLLEINGIEDFPSSLNFSAKGEGSYFDLEKMKLQANVDMDSSIVNGAVVHNVDINPTLENGILRIPDGTLQSQIVAGEFSARKNLRDKTDPQNELNLDFEIINLQPLSPLVNADELYARGHIQGLISERDTTGLQFNGDVDLREVNYDSLFIAESINGSVEIGIEEMADFNLNIEIGAPVISGVTLQDMDFQTEGYANSDSVSGDFNLVLNSKDAGQITQAGTYEFNAQDLSTSLTWNTFRFITPVRTLMLQDDFHFSYASQAIQTDTLTLTSQEDNSSLQLAIPYADSLNQEAWIEGRNFDFGVIQEIIFGRRFVDGVLLGEIQASRKNTNLTANGAFQIKRLEFLETEVELFELNFDIRDERLKAETYVTIDGEEKISGNLDVPFKLGDPSTFDDQFFDEPVNGELVVQPLDVSRFEKILQEFEVDETKGIITFEGSLSGVAGEPNMNGKLFLDDPTLSGIKIDSASASFDYDHQNASLKSSAEIHTRGQKAAAITADIPVSMDFRTFEVNTPGEADTLLVDIKTNEFNLSVFNDFLNKEYMSGLKGTLNADLQVKGPRNNMVPEGYFRLGEGRVSVPVAGITLDGIRSDLEFTESGLKLNVFRAGSGTGDFRANGNIELNGLQPARLDLTARARQFTLANTSKYNLNINLDGKLTGNPMSPKASGKVTLNRGFVQLQDFGDKSVEDVTLEGEDEINFSPYDSLALDMQVVIEEDFYVRNRRYLDMEVELEGDLDAVKETGQDLQLFGSLSGVDGYARPLGKLFNLEEANFTFSGPVENPNLMIRTSYEPPTSRNQGQIVTIFYVIEGTAQDPEFRFESEPPMEQQDIICYTLFGKPCYSLESWQEVISGSTGGTTPEELLVNVLLDEVEAIATRELGIDVVQIDNSNTDSGTSIKTGWYLNKRTFFAIVNQITGPRPDILFILEYMLNQNLDLIITQGGDEREGVDLRWEFDY